MRLLTLIGRELWERKSQMITSFLAIFLGITAVVAIKTITYYSERAVERELDTLGANVLILPKSVSLQDYYSADLHNETLPEEYVTRLALSDIQGVDNLSPKLCVPVRLQDHGFTLTGILPKSEFRAKTAWQGIGIFARPLGCGVVGDVASMPPPDSQKTLVRKRVIETLGDHETLIGADAAAVLKLGEGETLSLFGEDFTILAVLPQTGTVDDSRIFAHLHTVQRLSGKGEVVNVIEVVGCCKKIADGLVAGINRLLPEAKVVTVTQIVETQMRVNRMMERLSLLFLGIIVIVGGASIANYMYANVHDRRKEIGTLMALGATPGLVLRLFLIKALLLGLVGGLLGYVVGTVLAVRLGPWLAGVTVLPMPSLALWGLGIALAVALLASYWPARQAAHLDPSTTLQEV
ncbi:MAG: ABC transporter permease [Gemmataceae bacterium]